MSQSNNASAGAEFRLLVLGPASLTDSRGEPLPGMGPGKPLAMLAYLAIHGTAQREELVSLLWPEMPENRARNAFRQTLHRLRGALGNELLSSEREMVSVRLGDGLSCDAVEFQQAASHDLEHALSLYRGPFLGGLNVGSSAFEQWTEGQRDRLDAQYRGALARAASASLEAGDADRAAEHARALSRIAPLDPAAAALEAKILVAAGRKPEAVSVLTQHMARIESELGTKPAALVSAMMQRLVQDAPAATSANLGATPDLLPEAEFVGREREIGRLLGLWREIEQRGATAIVTGPAGIGKTRLLRELVQRISAFGPALLLWGQERNGNRTIPYAALADALRPAVHAPGVAGASQHLLAEAARLLPEIRDQFNLPEASPLDDDAARIRFFEGIASLLDAVAFEQPVCVVVEDLHHASRSSVELLHFLTHRLAGAPILFLISYRPPDSAGHVLERFGAGAGAEANEPAIDSASPSVHIGLAALDGAAVERLITSVVAAGELDSETRSSIANVSEGNPFRALDLVRRARRGEPTAQLPIEFSQSLWSRLQSCSPNEQRLFLASALLGRPAALRLLAAATHLSEPAAFDAALALEQRGLIVQQRGGVLPAHDVLAAVALEGTGSAGRALLAGWTADALAAEPGAANAELAQLYAEAGQPSSAHKYARAAVLDAAAAGAGEELDNLLALAAQTAFSNADRRAVQSLQTALQGGSRRLARGEVLAAETEKQADAAAGPGRAIPATTRRWALLSSRPLQVAALILITVLGSLGLLRSQMARPGARGTVLGDSAVVIERIGARGSRRYLVTGSILPAATLAETRSTSDPAWASELALPWMNPRTSPSGQYVSIERIGPQGTDIYVVSANQRDTVELASGPGDDLAVGWSPDDRWLLVIHSSETSAGHRSALHAYSISDPGVKVPLDTTQDHAVVDAVWSPTGMHVAWTARTGTERQQDVFVGMSDGSVPRNVTSSGSEEYHPAWSPDGGRLVFTTDRHGDAELYSLELETGELRRLTFDTAEDDRASFSPDGDFIAFESTRGGYVGVYAMPPLGGSARRLTPPSRNFELSGWRGRLPAYLAELRLAAPAALAPGATAVLTATAVDQYGELLALPSLEWVTLDNTVALRPRTEGQLPANGTGSRTLVARTAGLGRTVAKAGAWRADTVFTLIGETPLTIMLDDFTGGLNASRWYVLGNPSPLVASSAGHAGSAGLVLRSDRQWESGVLSKEVFPLRPGLTVSGRVRAPFASSGHPGGFTLALVAAEAANAIDVAAPQFLKVAALSWLPEAGRLAYSAEREFWSEVVRFARADGWHSFTIEVEGDGRVAFHVENELRRRSSIVLTGKEGDPKVQLWIGGRATGDAVVVDDVRVWIADVR